MLNQLISSSTADELEQVARTEMDSDTSLLHYCVKAKSEVGICYNCLHALADAGLARYVADPSWFVRETLFGNTHL